MVLSLARVDDRLIHGQVIAVWLRKLSPEIIVIADDETAADEFLSELLQFAGPPGVSVEVYSISDSVERLKELADSTKKTFLLMRSPLTALALVKSGLKITILNVGGIGAAADRKKLYKNISASDAEVAAMNALEDLGTKVEIRIVADDSPVAFSSLDLAQTARSEL
ncbi:MAG: PTS mannose/fructose/sorbose transporter subunit IIB [Actinobacteria bacterium]|uniref:Unannotated protein n=1 Tax=freshwater metagenome TaxID=449393 RepID=A0A6J7VN59_9ZZZZ|nr:PTS mannose/fructose/sorbose transporter subunit IIB [Actinomycetota bacterium]